jgi:hypothetical protein
MEAERRNYGAELKGLLIWFVFRSCNKTRRGYILIDRTVALCRQGPIKKTGGRNRLTMLFNQKLVLDTETSI